MAVKYFAGNKAQGTKSERLALDTQYFSATGNANSGLDGLIFNETDTNDVFKWDEAVSGWELVAGDQASVGQTFALKRFNDLITIDEVSAPTGNGVADTVRLYANGGKLYIRDDGGNISDLTEGAGATTLNSLDNVTIGGTTLAAGHILVYDGSSAFLNLPLVGETNDTIAMGADGKLDIQVLTRLTDLDMSDANHVIFNNMVSRTLTIGASSTSIITGGNLTVTGDLTVSGTTTTVDTTNLRVEDPLIVLNYNHANSASANDVGFIIERGSNTNAFFGWDETATEFVAYSTNDVGATAGNVPIVSATYHDLQIAGLKATTGVFSGLLTAQNKILIDRADGDVTLAADGQLVHVDAITFNDATTSSGTAAQNYTAIKVEQSTLTATASSITTTNAYSVYIAGAPVASTRMTITNPYALYVAGGASHFVGAVSGASSITGATLVSSGATTVNSLVVTTTATVGGTLAVTGVLSTVSNVTVGGTLAVTGNTTFNGTVALGNGTGDDITFPGYIASNLYPKTDGAYDIGEANGTREWKDLFITGTAYIDALATGTTIATPAITGGTYSAGTATELTKLSVRDNAVAYDLEFQSATTGMDADRILIFDVNNVNRTVSLSGNVTLGAAVTTVGAFATSAAFSTTGAFTTAGAFTTVGANAITLTTTAATTLTLPVTGTLATLAGDETLSTKTLTAPKFVNAGFIADANGNEMLVFNTTGSAEQHFAMTNAANIAGSVIGPLFAAVGDDTNVGLRLSGKGTGGVVIEGSATGACIEFNTKYTGGNPPAGDESARMYLKEVDANNNAIAVRIFKANAYREVEITSPKAICGECGSKDGALDPTYDFSRSMMIVELWCGHSYEVPMNGWNMVS